MRTGHKLTWLILFLGVFAGCNPVSVFYGTDKAKVDANFHPGVKDAPAIISVSPESGAIAGGTVLTVVGKGFESGTSVSVGGSACTSITIVSEVRLTCVTPSHTLGRADVVITNPDGQIATFANAFAFTDALGPAPGTSISAGGTVRTSGTGVSMRASIGAPIVGTKTVGTGSSLVPGSQN